MSTTPDRSTDGDTAAPAVAEPPGRHARPAPGAPRRGLRPTRHWFAAVGLVALVVAGSACAAGTSDGQADARTEDAAAAAATADEAEDESAVATTSTTQPSGDGDDEASGALLLIMDASGSMNETGPDGTPLIDGAKAALHGVIAGLPDGVHTGLRVFGHRYPNTDRANGCRDSELIAPVAPLDRAALGAAIDGYDAVGFTPIGYSLEQAAGDLPPEGPRTIILVSDGDDTCGSPDPCQVAQDLRSDGVDLVVHTVGFALGDNEAARDQLTCIAEAGGGGFHDVADAAGLATTLEDVSEEETNRFEPAGTALDGAEIPRDAVTGQIGAAHTDVITHGDTNYYRFEVPQGAEVEADVVTQGAADADTSLCVTAALTDDGGDAYENSDAGGGSAEETQIDNIDPVVIDDADEVYLRIENDNCRGAGNGDPDLQFAVEFTVRTVG